LIPDQNSQHLQTVYVKAEELFDKLQSVKDEYKHWAILGNIDLATHIEKNFTQVSDWDSNIEMLRNKRIMLKKLPDDIKIDCITINLHPFKNGIEALFRRLEEILAETLQDSIEKDCEQVQAFINSGLQTLRVQP
jgi:hypothetical protein